jgi:hypothetical protein
MNEQMSDEEEPTVTSCEDTHTYDLMKEYAQQTARRIPYSFCWCKENIDVPKALSHYREESEQIPIIAAKAKCSYVEALKALHALDPRDIEASIEIAKLNSDKHDETINRETEDYHRNQLFSLWFHKQIYLELYNREKQIQCFLICQSTQCNGIQASRALNKALGNVDEAIEIVNGTIDFGPTGNWAVPINIREHLPFILPDCIMRQTDFVEEETQFTFMDGEVKQTDITFSNGETVHVLYAEVSNI